MKRCKKCQRPEFDDKAMFCPECGERLELESRPEPKIPSYRTNLARLGEGFIDVMIVSFLEQFVNIDHLRAIPDSSGLENFDKVMILIIIYSVLFDTVLRIGTPGKMLLGLKIVALDGRDCEVWRLFIRSIFRVVSIMLWFISLPMLLISIDGRLLHDRIAGTKVVMKKNTGATI